MAELKPCPFCGGEAALWGGFDGYEAYCINCHAGVEREGRAEAIEAWNKRVEIDPFRRENNVQEI